MPIFLSLRPTGAPVTTTRSGTKPMPRHGTRARYRLEIKRGADGKPGVACDRCKAANAKAAATARASRAATARRAGMHIVPDPPADTGADTSPDTSTESLSSTDSTPTPGPMETAINLDIDEIPEEMRVPMHRSLAVLAIETARDYDKAETSAARVAASRQLKDLIASLRTRREGDASTALHAYLEDLGSGPPGLPGRSA